MNLNVTAIRKNYLMELMLLVSLSASYSVAGKLLKRVDESWV